MLDEILNGINRFLSAIDRAVHRDEKRPMIDLFGRNAEIVHKAVVREYIAALEERDAEIAKLKENVKALKGRLFRAFEVDTEKPELHQIAEWLMDLGNVAQDMDTEQGLIDALMFARAACALESDPEHDCFTEEFHRWYEESSFRKFLSCVKKAKEKRNEEEK